jgi:hypothetical protein
MMLGSRQAVRHRPLEAACEGSNPSSPAKFDGTNSEFGDEMVCSPSPAIGGAGFRSAAASPPHETKLKWILMLSEE